MGLVMRFLGLDTERRNYNLPLSQLDTWLDSIAASGVSGTGLLGLYGGLQSATGKTISEQTSLQCLAVFACVRVLSESIASMPLLTYRRLASGGKERATSFPLYQKLHLQPNPEMSAMAYREAMVGHIELWGNHYSYVERDNGGRVLNLWPLRPDHMQSIRRNTETGKLEYLYHVPPDGESRILSTDEVMHIRGLSHSGVLGYSPIRQAREAVGLTQAGEEYGARFFGNFSGPGGVLQMDGTLDDDAAKRLKTRWEEAHKGLTTAHRIAVLEAGVKWQQTGISPKDSQFLELRGFQLEEIAGRLFRVPLFMLGHTQPVTSWGSGIEQMSIGFVVFSLMPRLIRIEQQMSIDLLSPAERNTYFIAHLVDGLLRGDIKTRYESYKIAIENGWMNQDEARELENLNPIPDGSGQNYWFMLNYAPLKKIAEMPMPENLPGTTRSEAEIIAIQKAQLEIIERDRRLALPPPERRDGEAKRRDLSGSLMPIFEDVISRIVRRERQDVMALADKHLGKRSVPDFDRAIEDFYREHTGFIAKSLTPAFLSAGQAARDVAADEIDVAGGGDVFAFCYQRDVPVSEFVDAYAANVAERWADGDLGQIQALTREALDTATDAREAVQTRLDAWVESTPSKLSREHSVELVQAVAVGLWAANGIRKLLWRTHGDNCPICTRMNGKIVEIGQFFVNKGDSLTDGEGKAWNFSRSFRHPPLHGGCLPGDMNIASIGRITAQSERWFDGDMLVIHTARGYKLACTPNHPILTPGGWISAHQLNVGSHVISRSDGNRNPPVLSHNQNVIARIEDVAKSFINYAAMASVPVPVATEDFHGDGVGSEVAIIRTDSLLGGGLNAQISQHHAELQFRFRYVTPMALATFSHSAALLDGMTATSRRFVGGGGLSFAGVGGHLVGPDLSSRATTPRNHAPLDQMSPDNVASHVQGICQSVFGLSGEVSADHVIRIDQSNFSGHVYNLQTQHGFYVAENIITHNCDCGVSPG